MATSQVEGMVSIGSIISHNLLLVELRLELSTDMGDSSLLMLLVIFSVITGDRVGDGGSRSDHGHPWMFLGVPIVGSTSGSGEMSSNCWISCMMS